MGTRRALALAALAAAAVLAPREAHAIPAFARKYQLSCTACHAPFPRLKPYGEEFAARGFRLQDPAKEPARATYDVGDPLLQLPRDFPLAARIDGYASWKEDAVAETDAEWPWVLKFLSGGPIGKKVSYYFYVLLEKGESLKVEDIWMQFNEPGGLPLDLQVGQFQVCDPLFKRELRLERFDYEIFKVEVGKAAVDLTYDRGANLMFHAPAKIDVGMQIVNGNGADAASEFEDFDRDKYKNLALRIVRPFKKLRLGAFGYFGKEVGDNGLSNRTRYYGPDFVFDLGEKVQLNLEYLERRDDDPFFLGADGPWLETRGGFAELHWLPRGQDGRWALSFLYNNVDSDDPAAVRETGSVTMNYLILRNLRLLGEAGRDLAADATRVSVGLIAAF